MQTHFDLFSGIGGFAYAAEKAGFKTIGFSEIDKFCSKVLSKHWPDVKNYGDVKSLSIPKDITLVTGGFPCQPFSIAGKKKGKEDARYLWHEFYRIICESKPAWIVAENVTGIIALELDNIIADLEKESYETATFILPACGSNAPHRRERVWIIANRISKRCDSSINHRQERCLQINKERNVQTIQSEWAQFWPKSWQVNKAENWLEFNTRASRRNNGLPSGLDRIKSLGNSIVPQVVFPILKLIYLLELDNEMRISNV